MEDIKVGEYVRSNKSGIHKVYRINERAKINKYLVDEHYDSSDNDLSYYIVKTTEIVKHSTKLIDLIEAGDLVNGNRVKDIKNDENYEKLIFLEKSIFGKQEIEIKTILTKEQYEQNCYKVEV